MRAAAARALKHLKPQEPCSLSRAFGKPQLAEQTLLKTAATLCRTNLKRLNLRALASMSRCFTASLHADMPPLDLMISSAAAGVAEAVPQDAANM
ncbi:hypothetical protein AK812_SmicGene36425 [Symbiodinium microadriaticum]|uniref:Uncharacterized protein n=1 Tax=Symbiodinium microadriaticum TaxID=2951 RepID=A0A1Q9CIY4_SYMMI|nr:hypothetical protein AK812_SmicGene36425 [Symbiodinium microadriaticum]